MDRNIFKKHKGFFLWTALGILIYLFFTVSFIWLSSRNVWELDLTSFFESGENITFEGSTLTTLRKELEETEDEDEEEILAPKLYLSSEEFPYLKDIHYLDIDVSSSSTSCIKLRLYYSDTPEGFTEKNSEDFYLNKGSNEVKITGADYLRFDIINGYNLTVTFNGINMRTSASPFYLLTQGIIFFAAIWILLYFAARYLGVRCSGLRSGLIIAAEGLFSGLMILIVIFSAETMRFKLITIVLLPLVVVAIAVLYPKIRTDKINTKKFITVVLIFMTALVYGTGYRMMSNVGSDLGIVARSAWEIVTEGKVNTVHTGLEIQEGYMGFSNNDYFVRYPNNIPILAILAVYYKFLSLFGITTNDLASNQLSIILNVAVIMASVFFNIQSAKNIFGQKGSVICTVISALFLPYYINACRFYTDTMSMIFVSLTVWLYTSEDKRFRSVYIKYALMGLTIGIGTLIKGSIIIMLVAVFIHLIIRGIKNIRFALVTALVILSLNTAWGAYINNCSWIDLSESDKYEFPVVHWLMMGLNTTDMGEYSHDDYEFTDSYTPKAAKTEADLDMLAYRLGSFASLSELGSFYLEKSAPTWCDGLYMQEIHVNWGLEKGGIYEALSNGRPYNPLFNVYTVIFTLCLNIFAAIGGLSALKKPEADNGMFLRLIMLGTILFFMMWETKSRYILNFTPVFILAAIYGLQTLHEMQKEKHISA